MTGFAGVWTIVLLVQVFVCSFSCCDANVMALFVVCCIASV